MTARKRRRRLPSSKFGPHPHEPGPPLELLSVALEVAAMLVECAANPPEPADIATLDRGYETAASLLADVRAVIRSLTDLVTRERE